MRLEESSSLVKVGIAPVGIGSGITNGEMLCTQKFSVLVSVQVAPY
jgi:hypothetical protein